MIHGIKNKAKKFTSNLHLKRTLRLIWSVTKGWASLTVIIIIIESALFFTSFYIFRLLIDLIAQPGLDQEQKSAFVIKYLIIAGSVTVLYVIMRSLSSFLTEIQASKVSEHIDDNIHAAAVKLDLSFYESPAYFDTMKRARDAGPERPNAILINLVDIAKNGLMLLVMGSILVSISWLLLPLLALFVIPTLLVRINFADRLYQWRRKQTPLDRKSSYLSSLITGDTAAKEIRAYNLGDHLRQLYLKIRRQLVSERLTITRKTTINEIITTVLATLGLFACIAFICIRTLKGASTIGDVTLFLIVFPQLFNLMNILATGISTLYQNNIFISNLYELFDLKPSLSEPEDPESITKNTKSDLSIEGLSFTYPHAKEEALTNIGLTIPAGKIIAIVGLNGAGKTTLTKLITRLYDPTAGRIALGGIDIRKFRSDEFRTQVSVVFQDFGRYNLTVRENIRFGDIQRQGSDDQVKEAAIRSGAEDFISKFPNGYETIMGRVFEEGREVSLGQWQKIAIARAFYSNSSFLILDEATSALDAKAEQDLFEAFRKKIGTKGVLIISHRLSAVKHADYIYVMAEGKISQEGTHEELISVPGDYSRLFKKTSIVI